MSDLGVTAELTATDVVDIIDEKIGFCTVDDGDDANGLEPVVI